MHILFVCHHYPPEVGAPQRRWGAFIPEFMAAGHEVTVVTPLPHYPTGRLLAGYSAFELLGRREGEHGEQVVRVPFVPVGQRGGVYKLGNQAAVAALSAVAGSVVAAPDVIVSSVPGPATVAAGDFLAVRWRAPHTIEFRDAWPDLLYQSTLSPRLTRRLGQWLTDRQRAADAVVCVTQTFAEVLTQRGVQASRIRHIPNGIDVKRIPELPAPDRTDRPMRLLYLGTHGVSQGLDNAIEGLARVKPGLVEARFVGDGTEKGRLERLASHLGVPVHFSPPVRGAELWEMYQWADSCLVHLADWPPFRYTVPSKLYEVMAAGRHVTGVVEGEAARIIEQAQAGNVAAPGVPDQLASLLETLAQTPGLTELSSSPRKWVRRNADLPALGEDFSQLLEEVVRG